VNVTHDDGRRVPSDDLVGIAEIAEMAGVSTAAVANWRKRTADFPTPVRELRAGPVFSARAVRLWLRQQRKVSMTNVLATINLKGGVGKTTTTAGIAEMLAVEHRKKTLLIDLDPQTNLTVMFIGEDRWKELNDTGQTLAQLFRDAMEQTRTFDLDAALQAGVSPVREVADTRLLDLLPSSLDLIELQDWLAGIPAGRYLARSPVDILHTALKRRLAEYEWVIIDCPPNLGLITLNGLRMADGFIIPTIPDVLSTYGIPQILTRVEDFAEEINETIEPFGIVISKYREQGTLHRRTVADLRNNPNLPPVFDTIVPEAVAIAEASTHQGVGTLRQKYSYGDRYQTFSELTDEVVEVVEAGVPA
jgi:chromosome partitioning protein